MAGSRRILQDLEGDQVTTAELGTSARVDILTAWAAAARPRAPASLPRPSAFALAFLALLSVAGLNGSAHAQSATYRVTFSPDWFEGVSGLSLLDAQGDWLASHGVDLFPYDAGAEEGTDFSLSNAAADPRDTIGSIEGTGKFSNEPIASPTFTLQAVPPEITSAATFTVDEGTTAVATLTAEDQDTGAADLEWSKAGGADADQFTLSTAGVLAFAAAKDYENPDDADGDGTYEITVQVGDGDNTDTADIRVTVENVIELATEVTGPAAVSYAENGATRLATYTASSEADRDGVTWTLAGDDKDHFSIDNPRGVLRFHIDPDGDNPFPKLPDYEAPDDEDTDNAYEVIVSAGAGAPFANLDPLRVTVTVTDENEAGAISLDTARPQLGEAIGATLSDPDEGSGLTVSDWRWERSTGPNAWVVIDEAEAASYTPTAADTNAFLRVTATYDDEHDTGHSVQKVASNVVTGPLLTALQVTTDAATGDTTRSMKPAFAQETLHYAIGCNASDTMQVTLSAPAGTRVAVDGMQVSSDNATVDVAVTMTSDASISVTDAEGAHTVYSVHCLEDVFYQFETVQRPGVEGIFDGLLLMVHSNYLVLLDNNGIPRHRQIHSDTFSRAWFFGVDPGGLYRYALAKFRLNSYQFEVLDQHLRTIDQDVTTVPPLDRTDQHAFAILPNGDYLLMSYEGPVTRNLRHLTFLDEEGKPYGLYEKLLDSAIQITTSASDPLFTWNSWGQMPLEDCVQHRFARSPVPGYAHLNSIQQVGNQIVGSFRGCSKVLGIDTETGAVAWRVGRTNLSDDEWASRDIGPAPLIPVNDPEGEFCGQHSATILPNGHLLLYDNGAACLIDPWIRASRCGGTACTAARWSTRWTTPPARRYSSAIIPCMEHDKTRSAFPADRSCPWTTATG